MGERGKRALRVNFDGKLKLEFQGTTISNDAGLLVYSELDEALGLTVDLDDMIDKLGWDVMDVNRYYFTDN